jgi:hypothetical protein
MATVVPFQQVPDVTGMLGRVIAMKHRKKEFAAEQKFREDVEKPFKEAQARYMGSMADNMMTNDLRERELELENRRLAIPEAQFEMERDRIASLQRGMHSEDPATAKLAKQTYWGVKNATDMGDQINMLRLGLEKQIAFFDQALGLSKFENDQLRTNLSIMDGVLSRESQIKKGRDKEFRESFDAGVDAVTSKLLSQPSASGAGATKPVGGGRSFPGASAGMTFPHQGAPPQMTLEQALEAVKTGAISGEDLLGAWPDLEGVIDRSLLGGGGSVSPATKDYLQEQASFEQSLIKRLQQ